jgi:hypothetical protein
VGVTLIFSRPPSLTVIVNQQELLEQGGVAQANNPEPTQSAGPRAPGGAKT